MAQEQVSRKPVAPEARPTTTEPRRMEAASPEAVRAQLARITGSPAFEAPERSRRFLGYIVEETLAGRGERIKGYTIAVEVFGRDTTFDAHADPVVRIEAGRLRRALERYYLMAGQTDPVVIDIPKGGYVPGFACRAPAAAALSIEKETCAPEPEPTPTPAPLLPSSPRTWQRTTTLLPAVGAAIALVLGITYWMLTRAPSATLPPQTASATAPDEPMLVVVPFEDLGDTPTTKLYASGLTEEVLTQLAPFKELTVFGRETSRSLPPQADATRLRLLGARYALEGGVRVAADRLRVTVRLLDAARSVVLWSQAYDEDLRVRGLFAIQEDIARQVATAVAQPYGIVSRADAKRAASEPPEDLDAYACTLRFYTYRAELSAQEHGVVRDCLERAVARFPDYTTAWAMLSFLYLDEDRFAFNVRVGQSTALERARAAARRAVELDSDDVRALQALMMVLFFDQDPNEALRIGERALALNPNDTELMAEFGTRVAYAGEWQRGGRLVEEALARNPAHSGFYRGTLALIDYMRGDYDRALAGIRQANLEKFSFYHGVAAIIYAQKGLLVEARAAAAQFVALHPAFIPNLDAELAKRNMQPEDRARLAEGFRKAGLRVPVSASSKPAGTSSAPPG